MKGKEIKEEYENIFEIIKHWYIEYWEEIATRHTWEKLLISLDKIEKYIDQNKELEYEYEKEKEYIQDVIRTNFIVLDYLKDSWNHEEDSEIRDNLCFVSELIEDNNKRLDAIIEGEEEENE